MPRLTVCALLEAVREKVNRRLVTKSDAHLGGLERGKNA